MTNVPLTVASAAKALRAGEFSSTELTTQLLAKVKTLNPELGAFITVTEESALAEAAAADALFAKGIDKGPLQGIPYGTKDIIATANAPTTANSNILDRKWGEGYDATVVTKMKAQGAVGLGKLVLSEFAIGLPDPDTGFPVPKNPWNVDHSAAGSSSGTGVAVASGMILCGFGTDTGGSIRGPAAYNGHSGLKQTFGRVSKTGCVPLGYSLDNIGPMARSVEDCAFMLQAIAGFDPTDPCSVDLPVPDYTAAMTGSVAGLRIGVPVSYFFDAPGLDPEVKAAVLAAIDTLKAAGAIVKEVPIPHAEEAKDANVIIMFSEACAYHRTDLQERYNVYGKFTAPLLVRGVLYSGADYMQASRFRTYFKREVAKAMADIDILVTPTAPFPAPRRDEMTPERRILDPAFMGQWNLTGLPALAVPCGFSSANMPLSMQIIGKPFDEPAVLRAGDAYQRLTDWHLKVPPIAR